MTINIFENWKLETDYSIYSFTGSKLCAIPNGRLPVKQKNKIISSLQFSRWQGYSACRHRSAQQKVKLLELILNQIVNNCFILSKNRIIKDLTLIWLAICFCFGFLSSGLHFLEFLDIHLQTNKWLENVRVLQCSPMYYGRNISNVGEFYSPDVITFYLSQNSL